MPIGIDRSQYIGNKDGFVNVPYVAGENDILDHLNTQYYHVHGKPFVYPDKADDVLLTSGSGAWSETGSIIEIVPADTLTDAAFDLHWIEISDISAVSTIQVDLYAGASGSEVLIGATRASRTTSQTRNGPNRIQIPQQLPGTRISARLSDSTSGTVTVNVALEGHYYTS